MTLPLASALGEAIEVLARRATIFAGAAAVSINNRPLPASASVRCSRISPGEVAAAALALMFRTFPPLTPSTVFVQPATVVGTAAAPPPTTTVLAARTPLEVIVVEPV